MCKAKQVFILFGPPVFITILNGNLVKDVGYSMLLCVAYVVVCVCTQEKFKISFSCIF